MELSHGVGTPYYMSPELLAKQPYGASSDVWSLGVVAFELMALRRPFVAETHGALEALILATDFAFDDPSMTAATALEMCGHPRSLAELATPEALLHPEPEKRLSLEGLMARLEEGCTEEGLPTPVLPDNVVVQLSPNLATGTTAASPTCPAEASLSSSSSTSSGKVLPRSMPQAKLPPAPQHVTSKARKQPSARQDTPAIMSPSVQEAGPGPFAPPPPTLSRRASRAAASGWKSRMPGLAEEK